MSSTVLPCVTGQAVSLIFHAGANGGMERFMSSLNKYRVHEVAKDFKLGSKDISSILTEYASTPKNHMQVLTDAELDVIFEYLTQRNQVESIEEIFADTYSEPAPIEPPPEKKKQPSAKKPQEEKDGKHAPAGTPRQQQTRPQQAGTPAARQTAGHGTPEGNAVSRKVPKKKVIDTRGATINLDRYDERIETLVPDKMQNVKQGKEKFTKKGTGQRSASYSSKRRQEEQDKLKRLQLEIAKKQPIKVMIPDEISVGELASRLKKTGAEVVKQLMKMGVMASLSEIIDYDTAALAAMELGAKVEHEVIVTIEEKLIDVSEDSEENLVPPKPGRGCYGPCRPRKDLASRLDTENKRSVGRSRGHHPAHRRLPRGDKREPDNLSRHTRTRGLHLDAGTRRAGYRHSHTCGGCRRRHNAADGGSDKSRKGGGHTHHSGHK